MKFPNKETEAVFMLFSVSGVPQGPGLGPLLLVLLSDYYQSIINMTN